MLSFRLFSLTAKAAFLSPNSSSVNFLKKLHAYYCCFKTITYYHIWSLRLIVLLLICFLLNKALFADHFLVLSTNKYISTQCRACWVKSQESCTIFLLFKFSCLDLMLVLLELGALFDHIKAVSEKKSCT